MRAMGLSNSLVRTEIKSRAAHTMMRKNGLAPTAA